MKKHLLFLFAALLPLVASAEKVEIDGIWYNLVSKAKQAEVTYKGDTYNSYKDEYSGSITIPASVTHNGVAYSVTSIGDYVFRDCRSLTAINIPEGVTSIGEYAFFECSSLTAITLPEGVTSIGRSAFYYCSSLTSINIPEGVTSIGDFAFYYCSSLTAINIPEGVTSTGYDAFYGCSSLTAVYISSIEAWCKISFGSYDSNPLYYAHNLYLNGELITELVIPEGVTSIGDKAFKGCRSLTSINIPEGVTSIGRSAFSYCSSLTAINIPESVTSIGDEAFGGCSSLTAITLPEGVTSIGDYVFRGCSSLSAITIPEGVTSIGDYAFSGCSSLTAINIPEGVTSIGEYTFYNCRSLTAITCHAVTPPTVGNSYTFYGVDKSIPVYVPEGSVEDYKAAEYWKDFTNIVSMSVPITHITLSQSSATLLVEESLTLTATVAPDNATDKTLTWSSSNSSVATVDNMGKVTAKAAGTATITATANDGSGVKASCKVTVEKKVVAVSSITLSQSLATLIEGGTLTLTATVTPDDATNKAVTWSSSNTSVATVDANGKVTAIAPGTATITATANDGSGVKASCVVTVEKKVVAVSSITLSQTTATMIEGGTLTLTATVTPDDATDKSITWSSSNTSVATVDANGKVTAKAAGTATITATANDGSGVKASCVVTVEKKVVAVSSITLSQSSATLTEGETLSLTATVTPDDATDKSITWSSSNTSVATVDANGKMAAKAAGTATITATANDGSGVKASCVVTVEKKVVAVSSITLSQSLATLIEGETLTLTATVTPDDATNKAVTWSSSNTSVATVDANGKVTAKAAGTAIITATANDGSGVKASCVVTVEKKVVAVSSITLSQSSATLTEGETLSLTATVKPTNATNKGITWSSSNTSVATVDANGKVTAKAAGTATITATANDGSGVSASCVVTVVAAEYTITYYVDGEVYHQETLTRGTAIVPIKAPTKDGHTFSGWSEIPETMPAEDITITGTFTVNTYTVTFTIDGVVIASSTQEYGSAITVPSAPTREGYTFSGWGEVPTTMPASDVTYDATYIPNTYKVYYFVGHKLVHVAEVAYGEVIPEYIYEPTTEGDVFMGWIGDTYDTMPAHDVTYTANIANGIENSEINTLNSEFIYDLSGRKVTDMENLRGGIYIVNGKKTVIK